MYRRIKREAEASTCLYLISMDWVKKWVQFLKYEEQFYPGGVNNDNIVSLLCKKSPLVIGTHVLCINEELWESIGSFYPGGPSLKWNCGEDELIKYGLTMEGEIVYEEKSKLSED